MHPDFGEMLDTSPANRERYYALLRGLTPEQRAGRVAGLSRMVRGLAIAGIQREFPGAVGAELDVRLAVRLYGPSLARRIYGTVPEDAR